MIEAKISVPAAQQRLIWKGKALSSELTLFDYIKDTRDFPVIIHLVEKQGSIGSLSSSNNNGSEFQHDTFSSMLNLYIESHHCEDPECKDITNAFKEHFERNKK